jgi:hypothetical protein
MPDEITEPTENSDTAQPVVDDGYETGVVGAEPTPPLPSDDDE